MTSKKKQILPGKIASDEQANHRGESTLDYSRIGKGQGISEEGVIYDQGSVYERIQNLTETRKARGKGYRLTTVVMIAPEYPKPGFGKVQMDFLTAQQVNKGHGRIEKRTLMTSEMLNAYAAWPG